MSSGGTLAGELAAVTRLWAQLRVPDRARYLERAAQAVVDEFDELCLTLAGEAQRPRAEIASLELLGAIDALRWLAANARGLLGAHRFALPRTLHPLTRASTGLAPVGVVAIAGAPGAPFALPLCTVGAALLTGNGAIMAPAAGATRAAERIAGVLTRAGLPEGLVRIASEPDLDGCARLLDLRAGPSGPDAMIVLADARLGNAVDGALWAACAGAGQLPGSLKRVYVAAERHDEFLDALCAAAGELELGDPLAPHTQLGPLAGEAVAAGLEAAIEEATGLGGRMLSGGRTSVAAARGTFFAPAVLSGVPHQARLVRERVPGPVLAVAAVADSQEAVALANGTERSLGASIWSADRRSAVRVARELQARVVWGNDHVPALPLRQAAAEALEQVGRAQLITWELAAHRPPFRYRYDATSQRAARTLAVLHSTREGEREQALREGAPAIIRLAGRALRGRQ
jgi:acyl-CoA reductase-like NAD-dependent aldehyde dehydrogenase